MLKTTRRIASFSIALLIFISGSMFISAITIKAREPIEGHWYVTYSGDLIFPMHAWHILVEIHSSTNAVRGTGTIPESGFKFNTINLKLEPYTSIYAGQWSQFSNVAVKLSEGGNIATGTHTYKPEWDSLEIRSPMVWTRILSEQSLRKKITSDEALSSMLSGQPLINTIITGSIKGDGKKFSRHVALINCEVIGEANFTQANFQKGATFSGTIFRGVATFIWATFYGSSDFSDVKFLKNAYFSYAKFKKENGSFNTYFLFNECFFAEISEFRDAEFTGRASFGAAHFATEASFLQSQFDTLDLRNSEHEGGLILTAAKGTELLLGGVTTKDVYMNSIKLSGVLSIESDYSISLSDMSSNEPTRITGEVSMGNSRIKDMRLRLVSISGNLTLVDCNISSLTMKEVTGSSINIWNANLDSNIWIDRWTARWISSSIRELFPCGLGWRSPRRTTSSTLMILAQRFGDNGRYRDMNKAIIQSRYLEFFEILKEKRFKQLPEWILSYLLGFGRSTNLVISICLVICLLFGMFYWLFASRSNKIEILGVDPERKEICSWFRRPPLIKRKPDSFEKLETIGMLSAICLSGATFFKLNFGRRYYISDLRIRIVLWIQWFLGLVYLYAFLLSISSNQPIVRDLLALR